MSSEENKNRTIETFAEAVVEARRCLNCPRPLCRTGCPVENDIPAFIQALALGNVGAAAEIISARSNLPAICGRVCPHEQQCEARCILTNKGEGIRIGELERFVADLSNELILDVRRSKSGKEKLRLLAVDLRESA